MLAPSLRPRPLRLPDAYGGLPQALAHAHRALARKLRVDPPGDARTGPPNPGLLDLLPLLLLRSQPLPLRQDARGAPPQARDRSLLEYGSVAGGFDERARVGLLGGSPDPGHRIERRGVPARARARGGCRSTR